MTISYSLDLGLIPAMRQTTLKHISRSVLFIAYPATVGMRATMQKIETLLQAMDNSIIHLPGTSEAFEQRLNEVTSSINDMKRVLNQ
jgi:hypothetical protein